MRDYHASPAAFGLLEMPIDVSAVPATGLSKEHARM